MTLSESVLDEATENDILNVDVLIIGAGLFGSVIGDVLERADRSVTYVDAMRPEAGSRPAACLMKPSWLSSMGKEKYEPALNLLHELYGIEDITFKTKPLNKSVTVHWIPPESIMKWDKAIKGVATEISRVKNPIVKLIVKGSTYFVRPRLLIIAAGIWTKKLITAPNFIIVPSLSGQAGVAFSWQGSTYENIINVWAPYKQLVVFNGWKDNTLWVGDGSAIKPENWTIERQQQSLERCSKAVNRAMSEANVMFGIRPYIKGIKSCYVEKVWDNIWVVTGGAKNGTAAAGWAAYKIMQEEC